MLGEYNKSSGCKFCLIFSVSYVVYTRNANTRGAAQLSCFFNIKGVALKTYEMNKSGISFGFFSKKERPKSHELMSKYDVDSRNFEEVNRAGPSTDTDDNAVKKGKSLIYLFTRLMILTVCLCM